MSINKALVKHETRNMKWMMLYFTLMALGGILYFHVLLHSEYLDFLTETFNPNKSVVLSALYTTVTVIAVPVGLGVLLMIFLQFKDTKSIDVGHFLKSLPISNREYFTTKLIGGLLSITVPSVILILGVIFVRSIHIDWISDLHNTSLFVDFFKKTDSIINLVSGMAMMYLVTISTYSFLFMIQYIVTNIVSGLVIGVLVWLSPTFILGSIGFIYGEFLLNLFSFSEKTMSVLEQYLGYILPWFFPLFIKQYDLVDETGINMAVRNIEVMHYEGLVSKIIFTLLISLLSMWVGYIISKKSRVEDIDYFISFKWARIVFVVGVTVCAALLLGLMTTGFLGTYSYINYLVLHIAMAVGAFVGFSISMSLLKNKVR